MVVNYLDVHLRELDILRSDPIGTETGVGLDRLNAGRLQRNGRDASRFEAHVQTSA
jgi:hypothetical protein